MDKLYGQLNETGPFNLKRAGGITPQLSSSQAQHLFSKAIAPNLIYIQD